MCVRFVAPPVPTSDMERANPSDAELLDASRRGERAAFRELVERCAPMVGAVSYAATRDRTLSEDISQDTFVAAWRDLDRLRDASALRPWLCGIARNLASKARRRRGRELVVADPDAFAAASTPFDAVRDGQAEQVVAAALARVPDLYREALVLFYYEGRSTKDVAVALGVGEDVVYKRLSRGRRYLAAGVEQLVETELKRRRSRRDLGARVLAALPVPRWMAPSHADAASKGSSMWKLGVAGMAAVTITVAALSSLPRLDAAPVERANHLDATARVERVAPVTVTRAVHAAAVPQLPSIPAGQGTPASAAATPVRDTSQPATCAMAARHILAVALAGSETELKEHAERVERVVARLEDACRDEQWSASQLACVMAADATRGVDRCRPKSPASEVDPAAVGVRPVGAEVDVSCAVVGQHVAELMIDKLSDTRADDVAAAVMVDPDELPGQVKEECGVEDWSDSLRRCYAAATRFDQIVICNVQYR